MDNPPQQTTIKLTPLQLLKKNAPAIYQTYSNKMINKLTNEIHALEFDLKHSMEENKQKIIELITEKKNELALFD